MSTSTLSIAGGRPVWLTRLYDYVELRKPPIAVLVLVAVAVSYSVARWGQPDPWVLLHVLCGTLFIATSASALNQWLERHRDALMPRTQERPLPAGRLSGSETIALSLVTVVTGCGYLLWMVGWQPACWGALTWVMYVWIYTPLKTRTWLNTAVGAVAGALPVLIGWSAAGQVYDLRAGALFWLVFLWQFPHFMAIAWLYRQQYARAGMQMLPVVEPTGLRAGRQAVMAAWALLPVSVIPVISAPGWGSALGSAMILVLGVGQLLCAIAFLRSRQEVSARRLLRASLIYLPAVLLILTLVPWV